MPFRLPLIGRGMQTIGKGGNIGFVPQSIPGLALWLVADDISGNDGDAVASWVSRGGNAYDFVQSDAAKKPVLKKAANGLNGHNVVLGNGTSTLLRYAGTLSTATSGTVFIVYRLSTTLKNNNVLFASMDEASAGNYYMTFSVVPNASTAKLALVGQRNADVGEDVRGNTVLAANTPYLYTCQSDGSAYTMRISGVAQTLSVVTGGNTGDWFGDTTNRDSVTILGAKYNAEAQWHKGDIAEIILYDAVLSAAQVLQVEAYLASRYGPFDLAAFLPFGDSKTAADSYQPTLKSSLSVVDRQHYWSYANMGRNGYTAALWRAQIDADLAALSIITPPSWVLVNLGANDIGPLEPALDAGTWKTNFAYILDAFNAKWPRAKIYVMRIWRRYENGDMTAMNDTWIPSVLTPRSAWAAVGPDERVFLENGDNGITYTSDGIHPNAAGYALTASLWQTTMGY